MYIIDGHHLDYLPDDKQRIEMLKEDIKKLSNQVIEEMKKRFQLEQELNRLKRGTE